LQSNALLNNAGQGNVMQCYAMLCSATLHYAML